MTLRTRLDTDLISNMKAKATFKVKVLRSFNAAIKQVEVDTKKDVSEEQILSILQKQIKQRKESLTIYRENSRSDLADIEERELEILEEYLPEQLSEETLALIVKSTVDSLEATSMKDMGKVMAALKEDTAGKADPSTISFLVKKLLTFK